MSEFFEVANWSTFQHYKDRDPPWIKLHYSLISGETWVTLDDASRVLAIACMLIASRNGGKVPNKPGYIKRVAYLNKSPDYKPLINCGFLLDNSTSQADASTIQANDRPEERRGEERHIEKTEERQRRATRLTDDPNMECPDNYGDWAVEKYNLPVNDVVKIWTKFRNYWIAKPGSKALKLDWYATWQNWVIEEMEKKRA